MRANKQWPILLLILLLSPGCAVYESWPGGSRSEGNQPPAPVVRKPPVPKQETLPPTSEQPPIENTPAEVPKTVAQPVGPAGFLLEDAARKRASGDLSGAATSIERAMRIQAGNPWLSLELAAIRLEQGNSAQAELLAQRALAQSGGDRQLQSQCWSLTAKARQAAGDIEGAAAATARASN